MIGCHGVLTRSSPRKVDKTTKKNLGNRTTPPRINDFSMDTQNKNLLIVENDSSLDNEEVSDLTSTTRASDDEDQSAQSGSTHPSKNLAHVVDLQETGEKEGLDGYNSDGWYPVNGPIEDEDYDSPFMPSRVEGDVSDDTEEANPPPNFTPIPIFIADSVLNKMKVNELKEELQKRGLQKQGRRQTCWNA